MNEFNEAKSLVDLIDYQTDSVVSKTLVDKPTGTLTLFAFDKGQGLSEHMAPFDALVYIFDGESEVTIAGKLTNVKQGEMVIGTFGTTTTNAATEAGIKVNFSAPSPVTPSMTTAIDAYLSKCNKR